MTWRSFQNNNENLQCVIASWYSFFVLLWNNLEKFLGHYVKLGYIGRIWRMSGWCLDPFPFYQTLNKLLGHIVYCQIYKYLHEHKLLAFEQFGFCSKLSTVVPWLTLLNKYSLTLTTITDQWINIPLILRCACKLWTYFNIDYLTNYFPQDNPCLRLQDTIFCDL
jgi:hypothetical protein